MSAKKTDNAHAAQGKTGAVRKILQSQKTFANHLDDFLAQQQAEAAAAAAAANSTRRAGGGHKHAAGADTPMTDAAVDTTDTTAAGAGAGGAAEAVLAGAYGPRAPSQPGDHDPLLVSRAPELPSDQELRALLAVPPSTYLEARGSFDDDGRQPPQRVFCEVCGYWGRVRCMKCGTRVCALDCLDTHREECVTRYGL